MAYDYNPYSAINAIYNYKNEWDSANKAGDTNKKNKAAENAKVFYDQLRDNGYSSVADQLSAVDVSGAKYILDQYSEKNTGVDNQAYNTSMKSATDKNNVLAGYIDSDRKDVQGKYNDIYNYANQDVTKTDEYQSTYNNMIKKYDMSALNARDNAVASGGASNGGNIDSYAAANAMRQQTSILATGQQVAHQAGLDAYNSRISNVSNILNNLGVYNSGTYDAMNQTIANDANLAQQYFENGETAKNNDVARKSEMASVTGYVPTEWTYDNNIYLNSDGTVKSQFLTDEFDATGGFTTIINEAKAKLATTTDATERAQLQATINAATQAKALKTLSSPKYEKYAHEVTATPGQRTAEYDLTTQQLASAERVAQAESDTEINKIKVQGEVDKDYLQTQIANGLLDEDDYVDAVVDFKADKYSKTAIDALYVNGKVENAWGVDSCGQKLLRKITSDFASQMGGAIIDTDDLAALIQFAQKNSAECDVSAGQFKKVLKYMGLYDYIKDFDKSFKTKDGKWTEGFTVDNLEFK